MSDLNELYAWWQTFTSLVKQATLEGAGGDEQLAVQKLRLVVKEFLDEDLAPEGSLDDLAKRVTMVVYDLPIDTAKKLVELLRETT